MFNIEINCDKLIYIFCVVASSTGSSVLREGNVTVIDIKDCEASYRGMHDFVSKWPKGMSSSNTLCAIDKDGKMDPCSVSNILMFFLCLFIF